MRLVTSESVSIGHPDKVADQIADAILDYCIFWDKDSRVACEVMCTTNLVVVSGEVSTKAPINRMVVDGIVREIVKEIGYYYGNGFDWRDLEVVCRLHKQSSDIAFGVDERADHEQGAGDQGIMYGYAEYNPETEHMPIPIFYAHRLMDTLLTFRRKYADSMLRPDAKCQLTFDFEDEDHPKLKSIVVSHQHTEECPVEKVADAVKVCMVQAIPSRYFSSTVKFVDPDEPVDFSQDITHVYVNPAGNFNIGGPDGDTGVTGRKLIVDTYGGVGRIGGGAFSGKDPTKVDRSAAYMCRKVAKDLVRDGKCRKCEVSVAYAIGVAHPVQISVNTFGTGDNKALTEYVKSHYDFRPKQIIEFLGLNETTDWVYRQTAMNGHFGHPRFPWEK